VRRLLATPGLLWPAAALVAVLTVVAVNGLGHSAGDKKGATPPRSAPTACAAPRVRATVRRTVTAREAARVSRPVEVSVIGAGATATARSVVRTSATATASVTVTAGAAVRRRACARDPDLARAQREAVRAARAEGRPAARNAAGGQAQALLPAARRRAKARALALALGAAERRARALVATARDRLRSAAEARLSGRAVHPGG